VKLRLKLILAFLLMSVVPMSMVIVYSYVTSQRAFRQAVQAESSTMAAEMGRRMESMRQGLNRQMNRLSRLPFRRMMEKKPRDFDLEKDPVFAELMRRLGEEDSLVESLEFIPAHPPHPRFPPPAKPEKKTSSAPPSPARPQEGPPPILIHLARLLGVDRGNPSAAHPPDLTGPGSQEQPAAPPPPPLSPGKSHQEPRSKKQSNAEAEASARFAVEMVKKKADAVQRAIESWNRLTPSERAALEEKRKQTKLLLGREFGSEVRREGEIIGTVKAQISPEKVLSEVFKTRRQQDEIPFAVDAEGKVHTANSADLSVLETLPLKEATAKDGKAGPQNPDLSNWIVVTRKDPESGLSFGIARPIRQTLEEIRRTAVRNFGYGMGIVGLALLGILPLSGRLTRNLTTLTKSVEELASGNLDVKVNVRSRDELGKLALTFNRMAQELKESQHRLVEQERLRKELEMCRRIQEELLPREPLSFAIGEVKGVSIPAREVGGDFFNYFGLPDGNLALLVGDVSGKGVPAALLMANLQATLKARLPLGTGLAELAEQLDREIADSTPPELFLTLFMGVFDISRQVLRYVNAGHNTQYALLADGALKQLGSTGRPLGLIPGGGYLEREATLQPGDSLFLYTDGLIEAENEAGEEFGTERLEIMLTEERSTELGSLMARVEQAVRQYRGAAEARDDATIVVLKVRSA
jgi:serine phosphatase RsbU (regulator of sigma subunit)